ncbi:MAG TPA: glycosyltransferase family 4 protein [Steroidobacteraceae bacterium]
MGAARAADKAAAAGRLHDDRRPRVCFVVESGTDVRLVDGLAAFADVTVLARRVVGGVEISRPSRSAASIELGPSSFVAFAWHVYLALRRRRRGEFDFILVQGYGAAAAAVNTASRLTGTPAAMLVCSPVEEYYRCRREHTGPGKPFRYRELAAIRLLASINARIGRRYVVLSDYLADVVRGHAASAAVDVIPVYGVDTAVFRPIDRPRDDLRRARGLPERGSVLFYSSRIAPEKDSRTLLEAVARLLAEGRDIYLLHRSGGYRHFLVEAAAHGVDQRVIATDAVHPIDELPLDYAASDVCVQASRAEGLGYSVLEALACGVPVVATRVGGLAETVVDGVTGWSCAAGDAGALAASLGAALDDPVEARRRALAGRKMVQQRYEADGAFRRLAELIERGTAKVRS